MAESIAVRSLSFSSCCFAGRWQQQQQRQRSKSSSAVVRLKVSAAPFQLRAAGVRCKVPIEELSPKELRLVRKKEAQKKLRKIRKERRAKRRAEEEAKVPRVVPNPALTKFQAPLFTSNKPWKKKTAVRQSAEEDCAEGLGFAEPRKWSEFEAAYENAKMSAFADGIVSRKWGSDSARNFVECGNDSEWGVKGISDGGEHAESGGGKARMKISWEENEVEGAEWKSLAGSHNIRPAEGEAPSFKLGTKETVSHPSISNFWVGTGERTPISGEVERMSDGAPSKRVESSSGAETPQELGRALKEQGQLGSSICAGEEVEDSEFWDGRGTYLEERFDEQTLTEEIESIAGDQKPKREERRTAAKAMRKGVARVIVGQRKGENVYLSVEDDDAITVKALPRSDLDEDKQLEWLAQQLDTFGRPDGVHFSKLMRSGGLKITDGRAVALVQRLGELGNWRCAMQVVEWLNGRNQFPPLRSRYLFTTLLAVLGRARRPIESLNVFNVMREHVDTYPDMAAYHVIAVTLGQTGHMEELGELIESLQHGPEKDTKFLVMVPDRGKLVPDAVVYNAALNSCVPHRHWRFALRILGELHRTENLRPNSASYGLVIEVLLKSGQFGLAWEILERMELGGFHPNSSTYKAVVEGLGRAGNPDLAVEMVKQMEERGIVAAPGVYYQLARTLCKFGKWEDALLQVDRMTGITERPAVQTFTGLLVACKQGGHWRDGISVYNHMQQVCAPNTGTCNVMISMYGSNDMYDEAKRLFDQLKTGRIRPRKTHPQDHLISPDVFSYDAMLGSCILSEKWEDANLIFQEMLMQGFQLTTTRHGWILRAVSEARKDDLFVAMFNHLRSLNAATAEFYVPIIESCIRSKDHAMALSYLREIYHKDVSVTPSDFQKLSDLAAHLSDDNRSTFLRTVDGVKVTRISEKPMHPRTTRPQANSTAPLKTSESFLKLSHKTRKSNTRNYMGENIFSVSSCDPSDSSMDGALDLVRSLGEGSSRSETYMSSRDQEWLLRRPDRSRPRDRKSVSTNPETVPGWELVWKGSRFWQRTSQS